MTVDEALEHVDAVVAARGGKKPRTAAVVMETLAAEVRRLRKPRGDLEATVAALMKHMWGYRNDARWRAEYEAVRVVCAKIGIKLGLKP